jgi:type IX secretion system PorP/SprF family membrane protein
VKIARYIRIGIIIAMLTGIFLTKGYTQQMPLYSQYMMNKFLLNPAEAGSEGYTAFNITAREQWIGIPNSPRTHSFSAQTRILRKSFVSKGTSVRKKTMGATRSGKVGLGGYIFNDQTGLINRTGIQLTYAYHISIAMGQLSFGLAGTAYQFNVDREKIKLYDENDLLINTFDNNLFVPDANIGVYYSSPLFYAGLSASQLFQASIKFGESGYDKFRLLRHYYLIGGYNIDVNDYLIFEPSILLKTSELWNFQMDLTAKAYIYDDYWAGISFRTGGALIIMGGLRVDKFYFGYAFDYTLSSIQKHSFGSHEFMLAMKLGDSARRYKWLIRY